MPCQIIVREIVHGSGEWHEMVALRNAVLRIPLGLALTDEELAAQAGHPHLAAFTGEALVGCLLLIPDRPPPTDDRVVWMRQVAVHPDHQRKGIGQQLVAAAEELARQQGYFRVVLDARETAIPFYKKLGYTGIGDVFIEHTLPHLLMYKRLA